MKLTTKTTYGLRAILELAHHYNKLPLKRKDISERQNIPDAYLVNILLILKSAGIVSSFRGPDGGYILNRPPQMIKLGEIVKSLDGQVDPYQVVPTLNTTEKGGSNDNLTKKIWLRLEKIQEDFLYSISLDDIINQKI